ncbi:uncharacterized protein LOC111250267 [Varroa destructor]|uniref:Uncharacterized protein n=1 Tax=Varroa destructor TaxID=109461 RepID=A0A7M7K2Z9_VARDE|nr:uncharacterized protein LOC111250267 [Varroa destructor]
MFDKMLKCSLDGKSPVNGLQEKGKYIFIRTPSKEDSYKHLSTNMREHNNHLLSEEHNEDRLGRRDSQVIQESTDRSIILCALFLVLGVLAFSSAICICCKTSKDGNFKRQSLKHLAHIRRRFDSTRLRTPLHSALPSRSFTLFENDQMEPVFLNKLTNNDNCKTSNVTPVQEEIPLETRIAVRIDIDEKRNPVPGCSGISAAPVLRTDQTGNSQPRPQWTLSAEEKQRKLQDRERRIRLRNSLFDRVLSEEDQFEVYVVNEQQL